MSDQANARGWRERRRLRTMEADFDAWWEDRSLPQKILLGIGFAILGIGLLALFGWSSCSCGIG